MRSLQEQVKKALCHQKLFWPFTVWTNCSSDLKHFANFSQSREKKFLTEGQNNFCNKIPFLGYPCYDPILFLVDLIDNITDTTNQSSLALCIPTFMIYLKNSYESENIGYVMSTKKMKRKTEKNSWKRKGKKRLTITKGTILFNLYCQQSQKSNKGKNWVTKMQFNWLDFLSHFI